MIKIDKIETLFKLNILAFNSASRINSILNISNYLKTRKFRKDNVRLLDKKKNKKCYVIGLGPSLKDVELSKLDGDTIVVNHFYKIGQNIDFTPTIYLAVDNAFSDEKHIGSIYEAMELYGDKTTFVFSDKIVNKINEKQNRFQKLNLHAIVGGGKLFNSTSKLDFTKRYPIGFNVVADAIMLALYMQYSEIVLLGADFSSFASRKSVHVYQESDSTRKIALWKELFCYSIVSHVHKELEKYSRKKNVNIINGTKGSLIDSYQYDGNYIHRNNLDKDIKNDNKLPTEN